MTNEGEWVFDPFLGTGTTIIAAIRHKRRAAGAEVVPKYIDLAKQRIKQEVAGTLRTRPMNKPVYDPIEAGNSLTVAPWPVVSVKRTNLRHEPTLWNKGVAVDENS